MLGTRYGQHQSRVWGKGVCIACPRCQWGWSQPHGKGLPDWLAEFEVSLSDLKVIHQTEPIDPPVDSPGSDPLQEILHNSDVFSDDLGCLKDRTVQQTVHDDAPPKFFKPRPVPFLLKDKIEQKLNNLQEQGIISPVQFSSWAAPIVPVLKKNGKMRICGDYKITVNQAAPTETYPLPTAEELFARLTVYSFP